MTRTTKWVGMAAVILFAAITVSHVLHSQGTNSAPQNRTAHSPFVHALPHLDGANLKVTVVEVVYGPGQSSRPHSHPCPVIG